MMRFGEPGIAESSPPDARASSAARMNPKSRPGDDDSAHAARDDERMLHRRGVIPVIVLLALVVFGFVVQAVRGPSAATQPSAATPDPVPTNAQAAAVLKALATVQRAYDAGDARRLCRPGAIVEGAVIRRQRAQSGGCESEVESLMANVPRLQLTVRELTLAPDLATATVTTSKGTSAPVDLVRDGRRWLLSFSDGGDPLPALAGTG
jgi:hypothetical protein